MVLLQDRLLQGGLAKGLPGITYELADLQVREGGGTGAGRDPCAAVLLCDVMCNHQQQHHLTSGAAAAAVHNMWSQQAAVEYLQTYR